MSKREHKVQNPKQQLFVQYTFAILIDLTVLNLFNQYWDNVYIENFTISLLVAILLQVLLRATMKVEHYVGSKLKSKKVRIVTAWMIIFASKLIILHTIELLFDGSIAFGGMLHGVVAFIIVVIVIIMAEQAVIKINNKLADKPNEL